MTVQNYDTKPDPAYAVGGLFRRPPESIEPAEMTTDTLFLRKHASFSCTIQVWAEYHQLFAQKDLLDRHRGGFYPRMEPVDTRRGGSVLGSGTVFGVEDRFRSRDWLYLNNPEVVPIPEKCPTNYQPRLFFAEMRPGLSAGEASNQVGSCEIDGSRRRN